VHGISSTGHVDPGQAKPELPLIPLIRDVPEAPDPRELFKRSADAAWLLWLDSADADAGRRSFLACDPFRVLRGCDGRAEWLGPGGREGAAGSPLEELSGALERWEIPRHPGLPPFTGGAGGFFGYEMAGDLERVPVAPYRDLRLPDVELALYDLVIGWDHDRGSCWIASTGFPLTGRSGRERAKARAAVAAAWLAGGPPPDDHQLARSSGLELATTDPPPTYPLEGTPVRSTFSRTAYAAAVRRAIDLIRAGDVYQVNLSQRFETPRPCDPCELYRRLREVSPAPFGSFFQGLDCTVLSTSPERYLRVSTDGHVETRPIKGTRPRHSDPRRDEALVRELAHSVKDRAENLMIADLLRNDLSRVCAAGTVRATELFRVESYATVHHLVSTVEGRLADGVRPVDLVRASFPSGSVTGAPKIRAMEIIAELEPVARGPYCGAIGYLGFGGDMDSSVSIRIAVAAAERVVFHAGGAVVADSEPDSEYVETLDKARALMAAIAG
jgi:para-aminobenzoate synthetase component 1